MKNGQIFCDVDFACLARGDFFPRFILWSSEAQIRVQFPSKKTINSCVIFAIRSTHSFTFPGNYISRGVDCSKRDRVTKYKLYVWETSKNKILKAEGSIHHSYL